MTPDDTEPISGKQPREVRAGTEIVPRPDFARDLGGDRTQYEKLLSEEAAAALAKSPKV